VFLNLHVGVWACPSQELHPYPESASLADSAQRWIQALLPPCPADTSPGLKQLRGPSGAVLGRMATGALLPSAAGARSPSGPHVALAGGPRSMTIAESRVSPFVLAANRQCPQSVETKKLRSPRRTPRHR
jgi:hypothetical protein